MLSALPPLAQAAGQSYFSWLIVVAMMGTALFAVGRASRRG